MCELEAIQKELDELMAEKEKVKKMGKLSKPDNGTQWMDILNKDIA